MAVILLAYNEYTHSYVSLIKSPVFPEWSQNKCCIQTHDAYEKEQNLVTLTFAFDATEPHTIKSEY